MRERWSKTGIYLTFICRQDLWWHCQLKLSPSKALYAIFQSNDFNDYLILVIELIFVIQWSQPWNVLSTCLSDRLIVITSTESHLESYSHYLRLINIGFIGSLPSPIVRRCSTRSLLIHESSNFHKSHSSHQRSVSQSEMTACRIGMFMQILALSSSVGHRNYVHFWCLNLMHLK